MNAMVCGALALALITVSAESAMAASGDPKQNEEASEKKNDDAAKRASSDKKADEGKKGSASVDSNKVAATTSPPGSSNGFPSVLGFGPGFFFEDSVLIEDRELNGQTEPTQREERVSDGIYSLHLWALFPVLVDKVRMGGGLAWYNKYSLVFPDEEDNNNNDDTFEVGHTFQLYAQVEYGIPKVVSELDVFFGLRGGGIVVFPGSDVQNRLDDLERQGYDVMQIPRLGAFVGPHLGGAWPINDNLSARFDAGIQFSKIWLYDTQAEAGGSLIENSSHINTTRTMLVIGLEFDI